MAACIYARTSRAERKHHTTSIDNQVAFCLDLARRHGLAVRADRIYTDLELGGELLPTCWAAEEAPSRPALSAAIAAIEDGLVDTIVVRRPVKLGTSSEVLVALRDFLTHSGAVIVTSPEAIAETDDPNNTFAVSVLRPLLRCDTAADRERKEKLKAQKLDELARLRAKLERLEAELAGLE